MLEHASRSLLQFPGLCRRMISINHLSSYQTALHPCSIESIVFPHPRHGGTFLCGQYELDVAVAPDVSNKTASTADDAQECTSSTATATRSGAINACSLYENHVVSFLRATTSGVLDMKVAGSYVASALSSSTVTIDRYEPFHANNHEEDDKDVEEFRGHVYDRVNNLIDNHPHQTNDSSNGRASGDGREENSGSCNNRNTCTSVLSLTAENEGLFLSVDWDVAYITQPGNQSICYQ